MHLKIGLHLFHTLLNTVQTKFQDELVQTEKGLEEKENALLCTRQNISEAEENRQKLPLWCS